ncbi:hypothetical protein EYF80_028828 [Liparis tanakae]|uniref:Uncharacterized protein n=1 Tax=Liparis tanakae TaxID=230148 RepID=A0A4Z2H507_9TELE|nr:hypothetical protein EYF80_028828 [Liparis tanakae]
MCPATIEIPADIRSDAAPTLRDSQTVTVFGKKAKPTAVQGTIRLDFHPASALGCDGASVRRNPHH